MKLIEADGKKMLAAAGIKVPEAVLIAYESTNGSYENTKFPVFVKAQVLEGRRGKRGLVRSCASAGEMERVLAEMRAALGQTPGAGFLIESSVPHASEWFLAVTVDRSAGAALVSVSEQGGMHVEKAQTLIVQSVDEMRQLSVPPVIQDALAKLYAVWQTNDALSVEINPLAVTADGSVIALDAKIELDDAAAFRHPEWSELHVLPESGRVQSSRERAYADLLAQAGHRGTLGRYVELDGDIALILSGGGASLVALDALDRAGGRAANYVEISGNPEPDQVYRATAIVLAKPGIRALWVAGSFANFTDIQATCNAILRALEDAGLRIPIVIRRDGPNAAAAREDAKRWAKERGVPLRFDLADVDLDASAHGVVQAAQSL